MRRREKEATRAPSRKRRRPAFVRAAQGFLPAVLLPVCLAALAGCASTPEKEAGFAAGTGTVLVEEWGVEVLGVRQAMSGYILDYRMKVLDPEKAAPLFVRKTKPVLIDEATGQQLAVASTAKTGPLRSSNIPQAGRNYPIAFNNAQRFVKPGSLVTIVIGNFKVEHLEVK